LERKFLNNTNNQYFANYLTKNDLTMLKKLPVLLLLLTSCLISISSYAQSVTIKGNVKGTSTGESLPAVSVTVKGSSAGVFTNDKGEFSITVPSLPVTLIISSVGFETKEVAVTSSTQSVNISLSTASSLGQEIVVSATRVATKILESPVTIERVSAATIQAAPAGSYYDIVANFKGVDVLSSSLTFKTPTTRGFLGSGNVRFNQLVDGMDNQAPGLNFSVGGVIGLSELDVDNMELLPGASSALYGPGGMNGTLLINSKNPFKYQGLSFQIKQGIMHADHKFRDISGYTNWTVRWAQKVTERFAFKLTAELIQAKDWVAGDYRNYNKATGKPTGGDRVTDPGYNGINVYGDEIARDIRPIFANFAAIPGYASLIATLPSTMPVSRTGYTEKELIDPNTVNFKFGGSLNYKIGSNTEASFSGFVGAGNTVYTGSDRYSLQDLKMSQYKVEVNNKNWLLRGYTTQENSGNSYNLTATTSYFNEAWKPTQVWLPEYVAAYINGRLSSGLTDQQAHIAARAFADKGRPASGSPQFNQLFNFIKGVPIGKPAPGAPLGGGKFLDKTDLYAAEGQYNFSHLTKGFADILVGANYRRFILNSQGTLFADSTGPIGINEAGAYVQIAKELFNEKLRLTVSGRYDKNQNFKGRFTPRATALFRVAQNHNLRLSYQTAYRFPSTQMQWINLFVGNDYLLIGGVPAFRSYYNLNSNPVYAIQNDVVTANKVTVVDLKPESVTSFELGYKGLVGNKLLIDIYGYYGEYQDFLTRRLVFQTGTGRKFSIPYNTENTVNSFGYGLSLDYRLPANFVAGINFASDELTNVPQGFQAGFNTPKYKTNIKLSNTGFGRGKSFGFSIVYKWMSKYDFESDFINGEVDQISTLDAQISYRIPATKYILKLGGSNILNQYYVQAPGNPAVGGLYYVSFGYNIF
jgi:outer membrane receptor protein involved in Fe transport